MLENGGKINNKRNEGKKINTKKTHRETRFAFTHLKIPLWLPFFMSYASDLAWTSVFVMCMSILCLCFYRVQSGRLNFVSQGRKKAMNQMWDKLQGIPKDNAPMSWNSSTNNNNHNRIRVEFVWNSNIFLCATLTLYSSRHIHNEFMMNDTLCAIETSADTIIMMANLISYANRGTIANNEILAKRKKHAHTHTDRHSTATILLYRNR